MSDETSEVKTAADEPKPNDSTEVVTSDAPTAAATEETESKSASGNAEDEGKREAPQEPAKAADEEEAPQAKRSRRDREIANLRRLQAANERRIQELEARLSESSQKPDPRPKAADFDTDEQYEEALINWGVRNRENAATDKGETPASQPTDEVFRRKLGDETVDSFNDQLEAARARYSDFNAVALNPSVAVTPLMLAAMMESEMGADVLYYLGQHPNEAHRIALHGENGIAIVRDIAKLEAKLENAPKGNGSKGTEVTTEPTERERASARRPQAPEPIEPLRGGGASTTPDPERMSQREYEAYRRKQDEARNLW